MPFVKTNVSKFKPKSMQLPALVPIPMFISMLLQMSMSMSMLTCLHEKKIDPNINIDDTNNF